MSPTVPSPFYKAPRPLSGLAILAITLTLGGLSACKSIPDKDDVEFYYQHAREEAAQEIAELEAQYHAGEIDKKSYATQVAQIEADIPNRAYEAVYTQYVLRESAAGRR
jgi:hypothetical protein